MSPNEITSIVGLLSEMKTLRECRWSTQTWWRGQSADYPLVPGAFRPQPNPTREGNLIRRFKQSARTRHMNCPTSDSDYASWLWLAQHYRLPTRLLDWSRSPLVAMLFAVLDPKHDSREGVLLALDAQNLNQAQVGVPAVFSPFSEFSSLMTPGIFSTSVEKYLDPTDPVSINDLFAIPFIDAARYLDFVVAVLPDEFDDRMRAQQAAVTLHGGPQPLEPDDRYLRKSIIPPSAKASIREELRLLGITASYLWTDLDRLSDDLRAEWTMSQ